MIKKKKKTFVAITMRTTAMTKPTYYTFAHSVPAQMDPGPHGLMVSEDESLTLDPLVQRTIGNHRWLFHLAAKSTGAPIVQSVCRLRHGCDNKRDQRAIVRLTNAIEPAYHDRDISRFLKSIVSNMHCRSVISAQAGVTPYLATFLKPVTKEKPKIAS